MPLISDFHQYLPSESVLKLSDGAGYIHGENRKSMAYVGNVVSFITFLIENSRQGYNVFNYIDKPDFYNE